MTLNSRSAPQRFYHYIDYRQVMAGDRTCIKIFEDSELVGVIDVDNRTFEYEGEHSEVQSNVQKLENGGFTDVVDVSFDDRGGTHEARQPIHGDSLLDKITLNFDLAPEYAEESDPQLEYEVSTGELNDVPDELTPSTEPPDYFKPVLEREADDNAQPAVDAHGSGTDNPAASTEDASDDDEPEWKKYVDST